MSGGCGGEGRQGDSGTATMKAVQVKQHHSLAAEAALYVTQPTCRQQVSRCRHSLLQLSTPAKHNTNPLTASRSPGAMYM
jgi:hypothetical protein